MLIDILTSNNTITFNKIIAGKIGLHPAIYLSELIRKQSIAMQNNKLIDNKYCIVERSEIFSRTTLNEEEQINIDLLLSDLKILEKRKSQVDGLSDEIYLNLDSLLNLFVDDKLENVSKKVLQPARVKQRSALSQREQYKDNLKKVVTKSIKDLYNNNELIQAYIAWIDGVYTNPKGFLSLKAINLFRTTLDNYTKGDLDLALAIIDVAAANGYRDATWAINAFEENYRKFYDQEHKNTQARVVDKTQVLSSEEF